MLNVSVYRFFFIQRDMEISSDIRSRVLAYYAYLVNWPFLNKMLNKYCFCLNTMTIIEIVLKYNLNEIVLISITCFSGHIIEAKMETECLVTYRWPSKLSCLLVSTKRFWRRYAINFRYVEQQNLKKDSFDTVFHKCLLKESQNLKQAEKIDENSVIFFLHCRLHCLEVSTLDFGACSHWWYDQYFTCQTKS